uniref:Peptidase A1 domain-containing protein n=1 Tax=Fagus sylvatica TaxID=28930 RepID=A0A2N9HVI0_FAGSY
MLNFNQALANERNTKSLVLGMTQRNPKSLVLGMTHSSTSLPSPKPRASRNSLKRPSEILDMMEPLREVRDGYLISLNLGSPPQIIQVYMDTGSDLTWVPCGNVSFDCMDCDDYKNNKLIPTYFSPSLSSSCTRDLCSSSSCMEIHSSDNFYDPCTMAGCSLATLVKSTCSRPCPLFSYTYAVGAVTGFGRGALSLPSQLGFLKKGFSHCFLGFKFANNPNISSPLVVGDVAIASKDYLQFTPMLKTPMNPNYYYIGLEAITIGNASTVKVPLNLREFDPQGNGAMLIDSGTTYTQLPEPLYSQLLSNLQSAITYPRAKDIETRTSFDLCYKVPCTNNNIFTDDLPSITFHFLNNVSLILPQGNHFYAMGAPSESTVVKCLLFQSMDANASGPAGVFGSFQQQNVEVVYDLEQERVGFKPRDCALAAAAQGLHKI